MKINYMLTNINQDVYCSLCLPYAFKKNDNARRFAILEFNTAHFKLSWQSDLLEPQILRVCDGLFAVGIDLSFALIDALAGLVIKSIDLNYFFVESFVIAGDLYVMTELEVIKINLSSLSTHSFALPDCYQDFDILHNEVTVRCENGTKVVVTETI